MNPLQHLSEPAKHWLDVTMWLSAGVAAVSFWQGIALAVTIMAGLASFIVAAFRIHDRIKYGRAP